MWKRHSQLFHNPSHLRLFLNLGSDINSELWNERDVAHLSRAELQQLGTFLGITRGYSLPKFEIVTRILGTRQIWLKIRKGNVNQNIHDFLSSFPRYALAGMMRELGFRRSRTKRQLVEGLVSWHATSSLLYPNGFPDSAVIPDVWLQHFDREFGATVANLSLGGDSTRFEYHSNEREKS